MQYRDLIIEAIEPYERDFPWRVEQELFGDDELWSQLSAPDSARAAAKLLDDHGWYSAREAAAFAAIEAHLFRVSENQDHADRVRQVLGRMVAYTETHFSVEEKLMANHDYDDIENHRREHQAFTQQIKIDQYNFNAGAWKFDKRLMDYLRGWLVKHISASDQAYVPTLKKAGVE